MPGSDCIIIMRRTIIALAAALICALPLRAAAHDIPNNVQVQAFVKPDGRRLQVLMRVPLLAMREVDFPRRGIGILDLAHADAALSNAASCGSPTMSSCTKARCASITHASSRSACHCRPINPSRRTKRRWRT